MSKEIDDVVRTAVNEEERVKRCAAEIDAVCSKYGCLINCEIIFNNMSGPRFITRIIPNPKFIAPPSVIIPPVLH